MALRDLLPETFLSQKEEPVELPVEQEQSERISVRI